MVVVDLISYLPTIVASVVHLDGAKVDAETAVVADAPADRVRRARRPIEATAAATAAAGGSVSSAAATVIAVSLQGKWSCQNHSRFMNDVLRQSGSSCLQKYLSSKL